jgi:hypothetical protein
MPNIRNPHYNEAGQINLELEHATLGWIPYTACPNDSDLENQAIFEGLQRGDFGPVEPWNLTMEEAQKRKRREIEQWRKAAEAAGMPWAFPGNVQDVVQLRDERDIANVNGQTTSALILQTAGVTAATMPFRAESDETYLLTPGQMVDMGMAVATFLASNYQKAWTLKGQLDAATTTAEVEAIVWPAN